MYGAPPKFRQFHREHWKKSIASRQRLLRGLPRTGDADEAKPRQTRPPRAADTHPAPVLAACAPRPATPIAGRGLSHCPR
jgi:hypothetical protein